MIRSRSIASSTLLPLRLALAPVLLFGAVSAQAAGLPDTGQDTCYNNAVADVVPPSNAESVSTDTGSHPRQDCRFGRDPAAAAGGLPKVGAGAKGFDYTKVSNNGSILPEAAALGDNPGDWACTRDNITGLTWEIKTAAAANLRFIGNSYTWYDGNAATNGGFAGSTGSNTCGSSLPGNLCNTASFVSAINTARLCGFNDWRMPTLRESLTLIKADGSIPSIDESYFPNPPAASYWTGTPFAPDASNAWFVDFADGYYNTDDKSRVNSVRLVRGTPF